MVLQALALDPKYDTQSSHAFMLFHQRAVGALPVTSVVIAKGELLGLQQGLAAGALEDTMESFFLSETTKYLYLLHSNASSLADFVIFSTEGHVFFPWTSPSEPLGIPKLPGFAPGNLISHSVR